MQVKVLWKIFFIYPLLWLLQHGNAQTITTQGKDFYFSMMQNLGGNPANATVFITSTKNTSGTLTNPVTGYSHSFNVTANQVTSVNLPFAECITVCNETVSNKVIRVQTNDTVSVFALNEKTATTDATLVLPVQALGLNHTVFSFTPQSNSSSYGLGSYAMVVAIEDNTQIEIIPSANTKGGKIAGTTYTVTLNRAQSYGIESTTDLSGTVVRTVNSCKGIAVFGGAGCANVPVGCTACDHLYEQVFPVETWGKNFIYTPTKTRLFDVVRIMTIEADTVTINGSKHYMAAGSYITQPCSTTNTLKITAPKAKAVMGYITGQTCAGGRGDPDMFWVAPLEQYLSEIVFSSTSFTGIDTNYVNILVKKSDTSQLYLNGNKVLSFEPTADTGYRVARVKVNSGSNTITCVPGFSAYAYGFGNANSYAYSTGSSARGLNTRLVIDGDAVDIEDTGYVCYKSDASFKLSINFPIQGMLWEFKPGDTTSNETPVYNYGDTGSHLLTVYVYRGGNCSTVTDTLQTIIRMRDPLKINSYSTLGCKGQALSLSPSGTGGRTSTYSFKWDHGLGNGPSKIVSPDTFTTYQVILSDGCTEISDTGYIEVAVKQGLNILAPPGDTICYGDSVEVRFSASGGNEMGYVYSWDHGLDTGKVKVLAPDTTTTYRVILTDNCSAKGDTGYVKISVYSKVDVTARDDSTICIGETIHLYASGKGGDSTKYVYSWDHGLGNGLSKAVSPSVTTTYRVILTDNCTFNDTDYVTVKVRPALDVTARADTVFCQGQGTYVYAYATGGDSTAYTYTWNQSLGTGDSIYVQPSTTTTYQVTISDNCSVATDRDTVTFKVFAPLEIHVPADSLICQGQSRFIAVSASGGDSTQYTFIWNHGLGTGDSKTVQPDTSTSFRVILSDQCSQNNDTGYVRVSVRPVLDVTGRDDSTICLGQSVSLYASGKGGDSTQYNFTWSHGLGDGALKMVSPAITTTYMVVLSDNCTSGNDTDYVTIKVRPALDVTARPDTVFCQGLGTYLYASATGGDSTAYTYTWNQSLGTGDSIYAKPTTTTTYLVTISDNCSATPDTDTVVFDVRLPLDLLLPADTILCKGESRFMKATASGGYGTTYHFAWDNSLGQGDTKTVQPDTTTTYRVILSDNCTINNDTGYVRVSVRPGLEINEREDSTICLGQFMTVYASGTGGDSTNYTFTWDHGLGTGLSKTVSPSVTTTYRVVLSDNCTIHNDTAYVTVFVRPALNVTARTDTFFCFGQATYLYASATGGDSTSYTYTWNHGLGVGNHIYQQPPVTTSYTVTVTDNCSTTPHTDTVILNVRIPLTLHVPADTLICKGQTRDMYVFGTGGDSLYYDYIWDQGLGNGNNKIVQPDTTTSYRVIFTDNCTSVSDTGYATVYVRTPLKVTVRPDTGICIGESVLLYGSHSGGYEAGHYFTWNQGLDTGFEKQVSPDTTTTYQVILSDNCTVKPDTNQVVVVVRPALKATARTDTTICRGESVILFANGAGGNTPAYTFTWDQGLGAGNNLVVNPTHSTTYRVILTDNCTYLSDTDYVSITVRDSLSVVPRTDTTICQGQSLMLYADAFGGNTPWYVYTWNQGLDTGRLKMISPDTTTTYQVILSDNCTFLDDTASLTIYVRPPLELSVGPDTTICLGQNVNLFSLISGGYSPTYLLSWDNGLDTGFSKVVSPSAATTYQAILTDNCTSVPDTANVTVTLRTPVSVIARPDTTICRGEQLLLYAGASGGDSSGYLFSWDNGVGDTNSVIIAPAVTTTYRVVLTDRCNPVYDTSYVTVTVRDPLSLVVRTDTTVCIGEQVLLHAAASGGYVPQRILTWDQGLGDTNYIAVKPLVTTTYKALLYDHCTILNDSGLVTVYVRPALDLQMPPDTLICRGETFTFNVRGVGGNQPSYLFSWDNGLGTGSTKSVLPVYTTSYRVILSDNCTDLEDTGYTIVGVRDSLSVTASQDTLICIGEMNELRAYGYGGYYANHTFTWDNGLGQGPVKQVNPAVTTTYQVILSDQCTKKDDTAFVKVGVRPALTVSTMGVKDICFNDTASLDASGSGGYAAGYQYSWNQGLGPGKTITVQPPGTTLYEVTLSDGCSAPATDTVSINVQQLPVPRFTADSVQCYPEPVTFVNQSQYYPGSGFLWSFGDGKFSVETDTLHFYPAAGQYTVKLKVVSPEGCTDSLSKQGFVTIHPKPRAFFDANPDTADILLPEIQFNNLSQVANAYRWDFGDNKGISDDFNPSYEYTDAGSYMVTLYASNSFNCVDTFVLPVRIRDVFRFYIPDAFTPDDDGLNDVFAVKGLGYKTFTVIIYNRWGQKVFEGKNTASWDGTYGGEPVMSGVYTYVIKVVDFENEVHQFKGTITLLR